MTGAGASLKYSVLYLVGLALPYLHIMFLIWVVFEIFTPIMGRSGTEIPPEVVLAALVIIATVFLSSFFVSVPFFDPASPAPGLSFVNLVSMAAPFDLLGEEHQVVSGGHGLRLHDRLPAGVQRPALPLFGKSR